MIVSPMTFIATASCAAMLGAEVIFADVEPATGNPDPQAAASAVSPATRVIAAVDYAGHPAEYDALRLVADHAGALLLSDAAHSIGSLYKQQPVGSLADLTRSLSSRQNLTTRRGRRRRVAVQRTDPADAPLPQHRPDSGG